ncbi:alpha/beta fold hydrolase [Aquimarina aquimarini]|uniref:alpha/beta hydrolase family protein n=1 Tax=Aquimarina aquimarini TaxID=1191734 RepID=UPI000D555FA6|nr:alpha/beta fold hydrolase [Aquimarina aquimarini]
MNEKKITIRAKDGFELGAYVREPKIEIKGVVQINSGTGIPKRFYKHFANYLTKQGYVTIVYDYRGIGDSKPKMLRGFKATNLEWATLDMTSILDWSICKYPALQKIMIGHSMGGQLVGFMQNNQKIDKLIIIASGTGYWKDMPKGKLKLLMPFLWYIYMPLSTFIYGFANAKKIKQGENLPKGVALQWRKWCLNKNYWETELENSLNKKSFAKLSGPIKSMIFTDDTIVSKKANKQLLSYYDQTVIEEIEITPSSFGFKKIGHFGFFSKKSEKLWENLI